MRNAVVSDLGHERALKVVSSLRQVHMITISSRSANGTTMGLAVTGDSLSAVQDVGPGPGCRA